MEDNIKESTQKYSVFRSEVPRFDAKYYGASICKEEQYNINQGRKTDLATGVANSAQVLSSMRGDRPRMTYAKADHREDINTNVAHRKTLSDTLPDLGVNYSVMRSDTKRFAAKGNEKVPLDVVYDIDCGYKMGLSTAVKHSRQSFPVFRSASDRFGKGSFLENRAQGGDGIYDTDTGHKKTLSRSIADSAFVLSNMSSNAERFSTSGLMDRSYQEAQYNIDSGHKKTLATGVEDTTLVYSNVRTSTERFPHRQRKHVAGGETQYDTDCGEKKFMTTAVARGEIPSAAITMMRSRAPRFGKDGHGDGVDGGGYNIDTAHKTSMSKALDTTAIQYANVRTKSDRFGKDFKDKKLDVVYDTDTGHKMSMTTAVANSPICYSNMSSPVPRWKAPRRDSSDRKSGGAGAGEFYRPNERLLERLYDHFQKTGKLKQLQVEFANSATAAS